MPQRRHGTLTANTVATVTVDAPADVSARDVRRLRSVEVLNRGTTDPIYFRTDGTNPTVGGDDTYVVPPSGGVEVPVRSVNTVEVRMISAGAVAYSVGGIE